MPSFPLVFAVGLSILIMVHEIGHFLAALIVGIKIEELGLGLPPKILGKKIKRVVFSLNLFPVGGFVKLHGEEESTDKHIILSKAFFRKSKKERAFVIVAGVFMNLVLAFLTFSVVYTLTGIPWKTERVKVIEVENLSPAFDSGILSDDLIKSVNQEAVVSTEQFIKLIDDNRGENVVLEILRPGEDALRKITLVPREKPPENQGPLGVAVSDVEIVFPPLWQRPFLGFYFGFKESLFWGKTIVLSLAQTVLTLLQGQVPRGIAGPVGIYGITSEVAKLGILPLVNFLGILSINLAIINILPFPPLDGGRLLFIILEKFFGRSVLPRIERITNAVGFIFLIGLLLALTLTEFRKIYQAGSFSEFTKGLLSQ